MLAVFNLVYQIQVSAGLNLFPLIFQKRSVNRCRAIPFTSRTPCPCVLLESCLNHDVKPCQFHTDVALPDTDEAENYNQLIY